MMVVEKAAARAGRAGNFGPQDIYQAAKQGATQKQKAYASAPLLDIAQAAKNVMPDIVRNSGTPERTLIHGIGAGLAGGAGYMAILPHVIAPSAAIGALYNDAGQAIARHYMMPGIARHGVANVVRKILPQTVIPGTTYGD